MHRIKLLCILTCIFVPLYVQAVQAARPLAAPESALTVDLPSGQEAAVVTTLKDGQTQTKNYPLIKVGENILRLTVPANEIQPEAKIVDVYTDFFRAQTGDDGYWVASRGVYGTFRLEDGSWTSSCLIPIFGMKTPIQTSMARVKGLRFEFNFVVQAHKGVYKAFPRFDISNIGCAPYEDIIIDFHTLVGDEANYSGMGRLYRKIQLDSQAVRPLKDRIASGENPYLEYLCDAITVRITHAIKPRIKERIDYTAQTELPVRAVLPFAQAKEVLKSLKDKGVDKMSVCTAGWQSGGYDGRSPQSFPIEPVAGGEAALKDYIAYAKSLGFQIDAHSNFTDTYTVYSGWSSDIACMRSEGTLYTNGVWCGGNAYNLCPRNAWETFFCGEMDRIGTLGFSGAHYIDVFSAIPAYCCFNPKHPCNRAEAAQYQRKMLQKARAVFHGTGSECGWDHVAGELDYINYVSRYMLSFQDKPQPMVDGIVPLWEIVYHGILLANTDKILQNKLDPEKALRLVEFGGRPIFYSPNDQDSICAAYEAFKPVRYLQKEFMQAHETLTPGVKRIVYSDGSEIVCNYTDKDFLWKGRAVKPVSYELYK